MPPPINIPIYPPSLPPGYCFPGTWQQFLVDIFSGAFGVWPGNLGSSFNFGNGVPSVDSQDRPWIRTGADGGFDRIYSFAYGRWTAKHPIPAGPNDWRGLWIGLESDLWSWDGGDGVDPSVTAPTPVTGSFYEVDHAFDFRVMIGAGTLPVAGTVLTPGDTGGLDMVSLTVQEMPPHTHTPHAEEQTGQPQNKLWGSDGLGGGGGASTPGKVYPSGNGLAVTGAAEVPVNTTLANTGGDTSVTPPVAAKAHQNMPPYLVGFYYKRTARIYYTIP